MQLTTNWRLFDCAGSRTGESPTIMDIPKDLPEDAYCPTFLARFSEVERVALRKAPPIDLLQFFMELEEKTRQS